MTSETRSAPGDVTPGVRWSSPVVAVATALAAVLVLIDLGDRSLWYDEAFSVGVVDRPLGDALWRISHWELNQSPFFLLLTGWIRLGTSESFLRLLPAASTVLAVPAVAALGRRVGGAAVSAVAAVLLALHPLTLQWGQQLRGYSFVTLLSIVTAVLLLRAVEEPDDRGRAVAYGAVAALATYAHFFTALLLVAHGFWLLLQRPVPRRLVVTAGATCMVLTLPLVEYFLTRRGDPLDWISGDGVPGILKDTAIGLAGGTLAGVFVYGLAFVAGAVLSMRDGSVRESVRTPVALMVLCAVVPPTLVTLSTLTVKPLLETRFLVVIVPAVVVVSAVAVVRAGVAPGAVLAGLLVAVSVVGIARWYTGEPVEDWRAATEIVAASGPDADVVFEPWGGVFAYRYYEDRLGLPARDVIRPRPFVPPGDEVVVEVRREGVDGDFVDPESFTSTWLAHNGYEQVETHSVDGLTIRVHRRA